MRNKPPRLATGNPGVSSSEDVTATAELSFQSSTPYWTASDGSAPPTPTFSLRSHSRFPSSSSSLTSSSTSPVGEQSDVSASASKLPMPKLAEDPTEHDDTIIKQHVYVQDSSRTCMLCLNFCRCTFTNLPQMIWTAVWTTTVITRPWLRATAMFVI